MSRSRSPDKQGRVLPVGTSQTDADVPCILIKME